MTTLIYNTKEYNIVYIDSTLETSGDGLSASTALNNLPTTLTDYTCYLIRRADDETSLVDLTRTRNKGLTHIIFLGMPREGEEFYDLLDDEVKDLWKNDTYNYARIRANSSSDNTTVADMTIFYENSISTLICANCYFFRDASGATARYRFGTIFYCNGSNTSRIVKFLNCKFSYTQFDFENDDWLNSNSGLTNSNYSQNKCCAYVYFTNAGYFELTDCIINFMPVYQTYTSGYDAGYYAWPRGINVANGAKLTLIKNCQLNTLYYSNPYYVMDGTLPIYIGHGLSGSYYANETIIKDCIQNEIFCTNNTAIWFPASIRLYGGNVSVFNHKVNIKNMNGFNTKNYSLYKNQESVYYCLDVRSRNKIEVDGFYADFTKNSNVKINNYPLANFHTCFTQIGSPGNYIKNIDIKFPKDSERNYDSNYEVIALRIQNDREQYNCDSHDYANIYNQNQNLCYALNPLNNGIASDIKIDAQNLNNGYGLALYNTGMKTKELNTRVYLYSSVLDIDTLNWYRSDRASAVTTSWCSYIKCNNYNADLQNFKGREQFALNPYSTAFIVNSNVMPYDEWSPSSQYPAVKNATCTCLNVIEPGQFFMRNSTTFCKAWSITRSGSNSQASLKLYNNTYTGNLPYPLEIGISPYKGLEIVPSTLGLKKLVCYCARALFEGNELEQGCGLFWIEALSKSVQADEKIQTERTDSFMKMFIDDDSSWSGTADLTPFRIEVPIEVKDLTQKVEVKLHYNWYSPAGFVYVDPDIRLIDVIE